ncbi:pilus assembly protein N-terminal domain-containing protein [Myxococcaceae bacterium JPH2]|nr:pilus assembly protein N-terminal domain-containing protein [Myxococcaceae bacterium JPH2]
MSPRAWRWAPLCLALLAPLAWAEPTEFTQAAATAEVASGTVRVQKDHDVALTVRGAERVQVSAPETAQAGITEPDQIGINGLSPGTTTVLVWRKGVRPLRMTVEVTR